MPSITITVPRGTSEETKERIAASLIRPTEELLSKMTVWTYIQEQDSWKNGKPYKGSCINLVVDGPDCDEEHMAKVCRAFCDAVADAYGEARITFRYLHNPAETFGINGLLMPEYMKLHHGGK